MQKNSNSETSLPPSDANFSEPDAHEARPPDHELAGSVVAAWYGPLPPPTLLAEFDKVIPGAAERILTLAERQAAHRQSLEAKEQVLREIQTRQDFELSRDALVKEFRIAAVGTISAFVLSMTTVLLSFWAIFHGYSIEGSILGGGTIAALVGAFIYGSHMRKRGDSPPAGGSSTPE
jgi:uncharacterized membrane protein